MEIQSLQVSNCARFDLANIKKLKMNISSKIQLIVGSNGYGKSTTMNLLSPLATSKSLFNKNGYKAITIKHKDDIYELITDFKYKGKNHSFIKNGTDLNISGISSIQDELCKEHLGYTTLVSDITRFKYMITSMTPSNRKVFFLSINPTDLSMILDKHKFICSKIREMKGNITLLNTRKQELIDKKISDERLLELKKEHDLLSKELENITKDIIALEHITNSLNEELKTIQKPLGEYSTTQIKLLRDKFNVFLGKYKKVDNLSEVLNSINTTISIYENDIANISNNVSNTLKDIRTYEQYLQESKNLTNASVLEKELTEYKEDIKRYDNIPTDIVIIPETELEYYDNTVFNIVSENIADIAVIDKQIYSKEKANNILSKYKNKIIPIVQNMTTSLNDYHNKIRVIDEELSKLITSRVATLDVCNTCLYKTSVTDIENKYKQDKVLYEKLILAIERKKHIYTTKVLPEYENVLSTQRQLHAYLDKIHKALQPTLFSKDIDSLIRILNTAYNTLIVDITNSLKYSPLVIKKRKLSEKILALEEQLKTIQNTKIPSVEFLTKTIKEKSEYITRLTEDQKLLDFQIEKLQLEKSTHSEYRKYIEDINNLSMQIKDQYIYTTITKSLEFYQQTLGNLQVQKREIVDKLSVVNNILKEQESLQDRLDKEILQLLNKSIVLKDEYMLIEHGLSPSSGFPHKHLVNHINVLINNANVIINKVWSYPMVLQKLDETIELNYNIPILLNDTILKDDISKLSKGQQLIVNIAFMVSCMISMKITDYPVFLDECDDGLDPYHKQKFLELQRYLVDSSLVSQLFIVNHEAASFDGFSDSEICALCDSNFIKSNNVNTHVELQ